MNGIGASGNDIRRINQLLPLVWQSAEDLVARISLSDNAFPELARDIAQYREAISAPIPDIPWGFVWGIGVRLEEAAAAAEREGVDRLAPSLEDASLAALQALRTLHAALILATMEGRELQEQADSLRMTRAEQAAFRNDAVALSNGLERSAGIIEQDASAIVAEAANAIGKGRHPERATTFGIAAITHIAIVLISAAVSVELGELIGGVVGAGRQAVTMATWEVMKGSRIVRSAVSTLGEQFSKLFESGSTILKNKLAQLAPLRRFVRDNELHLRRIAIGTPQLRWIRTYVDYIMRTDRSEDKGA